MKYAVIQITNGSFSIKSEWSDLEKAKGISKSDAKNIFDYYHNGE